MLASADGNGCRLTKRGRRRPNARIECTHADDAQTEALRSTCDVAQKQTFRSDGSSPFDRLWFVRSDECVPRNEVCRIDNAVSRHCCDDRVAHFAIVRYIITKQRYSGSRYTPARGTPRLVRKCTLHDSMCASNAASGRYNRTVIPHILSKHHWQSSERPQQSLGWSISAVIYDSGQSKQKWI